MLFQFPITASEARRLHSVTRTAVTVYGRGRARAYRVWPAGQVKRDKPHVLGRRYARAFCGVVSPLTAASVASRPRSLTFLTSDFPRRPPKTFRSISDDFSSDPDGAHNPMRVTSPGRYFTRVSGLVFVLGTRIPSRLNPRLNLWYGPCRSGKFNGGRPVNLFWKMYFRKSRSTRFFSFKRENKKHYVRRSQAPVYHVEIHMRRPHEFQRANTGLLD